MMQKQVVEDSGAKGYRYGQQQGPFKWRTGLFSSEHGNVLVWKWIWAPIHINKKIVLNPDMNQYVFADTNGQFPILDIYENISFNSVFIVADNFDLTAAVIFLPPSPQKVT